MTLTSPDLLSPRTDLPFQYIGGDPALDLVNTVDWTSRGPELDRLTDFDRLVEWAEGARVLTGKSATSFRARARARPREAEAAHRSALRARGVLQRLFQSIATGEPAEPALHDFNQLLGKALGRMRVTAAGGRPKSAPTLQLGWQDRETSLDSILWPVVWSAAGLLVSEEAPRIRTCGGPDCGWIYVDRSRNKLRRWCQMETCGTREKSRRRYQRGRAVRR
jgi:predicted RNA-binding Zn ribbon-like protein